MKKYIRILSWFLVLLMACGLLAFTPATRSGPVATRTPLLGQQVDKDLSFTLQREQNWLERQQIHLTWAAQIAAKTQELIDKAQAKGLDVTDLRNALASFNSGVASAQSSHDQAASVLKARVGFDADGNVTDRQAAHSTVVEARNDLRQAHLTLVNAVLSLRTALQDWRVKNRNI